MEATLDVLLQGLASNDVLVETFDAICHDAYGLIGEMGSYAELLWHGVENLAARIDLVEVFVLQSFDDFLADGQTPSAVPLCA